MARKPVFDDCMLCGECPCVCRRPAKKAAAKRAPKKTVVAATEEPAKLSSRALIGGSQSKIDAMPVPVPVAVAVDTPRPKADPRAAMRAAAARVQPATASEPVAPPRQKMHEEAKTTGDPIIDQAIGNLATLLHPEERRRWQWLMWSPSPVSERAARWKNRRREVAQ